MTVSSGNSRTTASGPARLRVGFVALNDAAPLIVARELGLYKKHGVEVDLSLEVGWATVRDKIVGRRLDAAHALGPMPFAITLGLGSIACPCLTGLVLNLGGNGITLSRELHERGAVDANQLRLAIAGDRGKRTRTLGVVFPYSSHWSLLRRWLRLGGIDPEKDVKLVIVPPSLLFRTLKTGHIDGYCVGEPWNTLAVDRKMGAFVARSADIDPRHPEKVLMVRKDFHDTRREEHISLIAALLEACRFCDEPANRTDVVRILVNDGRFGVSESVLRQSVEGGHTLSPVNGTNREPDPILFSGDPVNRPDAAKAEWILDALLENNVLPRIPVSPIRFGQRIFREDIHNEALERTGSAVRS